MANTISSQPAANSIVASYRPVIFQFTVDLAAIVIPLGTTSINPTSLCDVYLDGTFYRTLTKTQPISTTATTATYEFDAQDSIQEYLGKYLAANGSGSIAVATALTAQMFCRFRRTYLNLSGFQNSEVTAPIQGTGSTAAIPGTGLQSNTIHAVNATLQHDDNQTLSTHLNGFKTGAWHANAYPLTHRRPGIRINRIGSDYFPVLINDSGLLPECVKINYRKKNDNIWMSETVCSGPGCINPYMPVFVLPSAMESLVYFFSAPITLGTGPFTITAVTKPAWMTITVNGSDIEISGTPANASITANTPVNFTIQNACGSQAIVNNIQVLAFSNCQGAAFVGTPNLPAGTVGEPYSYAINITGTAPFSMGFVTKPSWMTITLVGSTINITGTPDAAAISNVEFLILNCANGSNIPFSDTVNITAYTGCLLFEFSVFGADDSTWSINGTACGGAPISLSGFVGDGNPASICGTAITVGGNLIIANNTTHC